MKKVGTLYRESLVDRIKTGVDENSNIFLMSYSNVSGIQLSDFRKNLKQVGARAWVSKNSLARIALKDMEQDKLAEQVSDQTAFIWGNEDAVEIAKVLVKFEKDCQEAQVKGALLEGRIVEADDVKKLSELPSREILLATLLATIQAPLTRLAGALNAKSRDLLSILKQLSEKKGGK